MYCIHACTIRIVPTYVHTYVCMFAIRSEFLLSPAFSPTMMTTTTFVWQVWRWLLQALLLHFPFHFPIPYFPPHSQPSSSSHIHIATQESIIRSFLQYFLLPLLSLASFSLLTRPFLLLSPRRRESEECAVENEGMYNICTVHYTLATYIHAYLCT